MIGALTFVVAAIGGALTASAAQRSKREVRRLEARVAELTLLADRDALTGLLNRRSFERHFDAEWKRAMRHQSHLAVAMIDVDEFKLYNDTYGHAAGDVALQAVADILQVSVYRVSDHACRVGGEEFALILPDTDHDGAERIAARVLMRLRNNALPHSHSQHGVVTASIGLCVVIPRPEMSEDVALSLADRALYAAKRAGRARMMSVVYRNAAEAVEAAAV